MDFSLRKMLISNKITVTSYDKMKQAYYKYYISDVKLIKKRFKENLDRDIELDNPIKFNDKLQWLKLNWHDSLATKCADKYEVRDFVKERIGEEYLNEMLSIYESVDEIKLDELPNSFVLKGTHGSGFNVICENKETMNWDVEFKKMQRWLKTNYYWPNREWVYKDIKPRIICEKFIDSGKNEELKDYRLFCFNGEPKFISVDFNINDKSKTRRNLYTLEWELMDEEISYPKELGERINKPKRLQEMIDISKELSEGFPHVRVDFYYINDKIIFGEMTFGHQSGFGDIRPDIFEVKMGEWLKLPNIK